MGRSILSICQIINIREENEGQSLQYTGEARPGEWKDDRGTCRNSASKAFRGCNITTEGRYSSRWGAVFSSQEECPKLCRFVWPMTDKYVSWDQ